MGPVYNRAEMSHDQLIQFIALILGDIRNNLGPKVHRSHCKTIPIYKWHMHVHVCVCVCVLVFIYSKTSQTDQFYRSTTSLYGPTFHETEIKNTVSSMYYGKFCKSTTSLNGPTELTPVNGRYREVLL